LGTIHNVGIININNNGSIINNHLILNDGIINNDGKIAGAGAVVNQPGSQFSGNLPTHSIIIGEARGTYRVR